jgi:hypothetical protein
MIIAFTGYSLSGKDEAAKGLKGFQRRAFADALKQEVQAFCISNYKINPLNCTPAEKEFIRTLLVHHGRAMRQIQADYWIQHVAASMRVIDQLSTARMSELKPIPADFAITDCRYLNEALWVESLGGIVVWVIRPGCGPANTEERGSIEEIVASGLIPKTIDNCGTVEELHEKVRRLV